MKTIKKTMYLVMVFAAVFFTAYSSDDDLYGTIFCHQNYYIIFIQIFEI